MKWSDIPRNPSPRMLRQFAGLWILFFAGMGLWQYLAHARTDLAFGLMALAFTIGPLGLMFPAAIKPIFVAWLVLAFPIGWLVSRVVLMILFWGVLTPVGVVQRLFGRDVLGLRRPQHVTSYWMPKERSTEVRSYFRQF